MSAFFKPAIKLMNHLKYPQKFLLLGIIVTMALTFQTYQMDSQSLDIVNFSKKELIGVEYINRLKDVMFDLQKYRHLENEQMLGIKNNGDEFGTIENKIDQDFGILTPKQIALASALNTEITWNALKSKWALIKASTIKSSDISKFDALTTLIADFQNLITQSCDSSNLTLDPDIDTYYLMDNFCTKLPSFIEQAAVINDIGTKALLLKPISSTDQNKLIIAKTLIDKFNKISIQNNFDKVFNERPAIKEQMTPYTERIFLDTSNLTDYLDKILSSAVNLSPQDFSEKYLSLINNTYQIYDLTSANLYDLLKMRVMSKMRDLYISIFTVVISMLLLIYLFSGVYLSIINSIRRLVFGAEQIATGDLTYVVELSAKDELLQIASSFNAMRDTLANIITEAMHVLNSLDTAADKIKSGNNDLAKRTEQQAAFLEETSASIEELTVTVKQNAENAKEANQLAKSASDVAIQGGSVVSEVISTMTAINESSQKIVDIISVIDNIALQTNILALNAAVEAARAGEQGRGFAVVATEVRNLAQRTSIAAKEIKTLITHSVEKVSGGTKLVDQAGQTMEKIVKAVNHVTSIMSEIASASIEQSTGIEEVNEAVIEMDKVTQQNSAMVEQAATAANSLESQTTQMSNLVRVFKLKGALKKNTPTMDDSLSPTSLNDNTAKSNKKNLRNDVWGEF